MLNRKYRATRLDIEETIKTGTSILGDFLYTKMSRKDGEKFGFAIVVSKKNEKTSVGRHLIKRRISSYIEKNLSRINPKFKKTIVFLIKKTKEPLDYKKVEKDVAMQSGLRHVSGELGARKILKAWCQIWVFALLEIAAGVLWWGSYQDGRFRILPEARLRLRRPPDFLLPPALQNVT